MGNTTRFSSGDRIRIQCGSMFDGYEGYVTTNPNADGLVRFTITVFNRPVELTLEPEKLIRIGTQTSENTENLGSDYTKERDQILPAWDAARLVQEARAYDRPEG